MMLVALVALLAASGCSGDSSPAPGSVPGPVPVLSVSPDNLVFAGQTGGGNPASVSLSVTNTGGGTLSWTASDNAAWFSVSPDNGTAPSTLTVSVVVAGLAAGTYDGAVTIASAGASGSPGVIPVTLTVTDSPPPTVLSVTPGNLSFTGQAGGGNPASQSLSVTNTGGGTLSWTATASGNATWLSVTPAGGTAPSTLTVSVDISGLAAGTYDGAVTVASAGATGSPQVIPVTLTVPPAAFPQISLITITDPGFFTQPVHVTHAGDGSGRIFVVEQAGRIRILDNGVVLPAPFLDLASLIPPRLVAGGEQGLLSVAFPPGFAAKRYFYVYYTRAADGAIVVARYRVSAGNRNVADPASEEAILVVLHPVFGNHNGGQLAFGPDGYLYVGTGDGGSGGDPGNNAQNAASMLGKLLRIDVESGAAPYVVPPDNPFVGVAGYRPEIWALGLRNPWRFAFDRVTGDLYIGDVGQSSLEEIDFQPAGDRVGRNYGWNIMEGDSCYPPGTVGCGQTGLALPVFVYGHSLGCSVTGGHVYRGAAFPSLQGVYLFGDYCSGRIWGLRRNGAVWDSTLLFTPALNISTLGEDEEGNVYVANHTNGEILKIVVP